MPTYLRWIAAATTAVTAQFAYFVVVGAIAVGTDNTTLGSGAGLLITIGSTFVALIPGFAVNDWLAKRYPSRQKDESMGAELHSAQPTAGDGL